MGVRTIGIRFTGDWGDLKSAMDQIDARVKATVAGADKATAAGGTAAKATAAQVAQSADAVTASQAKVEAAQQKAAKSAQAAGAESTKAAEKYAAAQGATAAAAERASVAQVKAAKSAADAQSQVGTAAEKAALIASAAADASAAEQAAAQEQVAQAAEEAASREVAAAQEVADAAQESTSSAEESSSAATASSAETAAAFTKVGQGLLLAGGATAAGLTIATKGFVDFDAAMSQVAAATGETSDNLDALRAAAIEAGAATQFSAVEAAEGITAMAKAGVDSKDILGGGLKGALDLAAAGQLDVGEASEIAATAMTQFNLSGKEIPHVADLLAAGAGKAQGEVTDLALALSYVGPVAKGVGVSIEETVGTIAELSSQGIIGEKAGTGLRSMLISLTAPPTAARKTLKEYGIQLRDSKGEFIGLAGAADELKSKLSKLSPAQRDAALKTIFGTEALTAARVIYQGGAKDIENWTAQVNDNGYAAKQASALTDNLAGDVERLGGSLSSVFITGSGGFNAPLRDLVKLTQLAVDTFGKLPGPIQEGAFWITAIGAAALITGGSLLILIPKIVETQAALATLGVTAAGTRATLASVGKGGAIIAGVAALFYGLGKVEDAFRPAAAEADNLTRAFNQLATTGKTTGVDLGESFGPNFDNFGKQLHDLGDPSLWQRVNDFAGVANHYLTFGALGSKDGTDERAAFLEDLKTADGVLAQMVTSGHADQAAAGFDYLNKKAIAAGKGVNYLGGKLPEYTAAQKDASDAAAANKAALDGYTKGVIDLGEAARDAGKELKDLIADLVKAGIVQLDARQAARDHINALHDLAKAVKAGEKHGADANGDQEKKKNQEAAAALDAYARDSLSAAQAIFDATGSQEKFTESLQASRTHLIDAADQLGYTKKEAIAFADAILQVPPVKRTTVLADIKDAKSKIGEIEEKLKSKKLTKPERVKLEADLAQYKRQLAEAEDALATLPTDKKVRLIGEVKDLTSKIADAEKRLKDPHLTDPERTKLRADLSKWKKELREAQHDLDAIKSKRVVLSIDTIRRDIDLRGKAAADTRARSGSGGLASGGKIPAYLSAGPTADDVPIMVSGQEWVIRAASSIHYGDRIMDAINRGSIPKSALTRLAGFADGGSTSTAASVAVRAGVPAQQAAAPIVIRVPVYESHVRTVQTGDLHFPGASPADFEDWAHSMQRRAERAYS